MVATKTHLLRQLSSDMDPQNAHSQMFTLNWRTYKFEVFFFFSCNELLRSDTTAPCVMTRGTVHESAPRGVHHESWKECEAWWVWKRSNMVRNSSFYFALLTDVLLWLNIFSEEDHLHQSQSTLRLKSGSALMMVIVFNKNIKPL